MATVTGTRRLLDISGNNISTAVSLEASGTLLDVNGQSGTSGQILSSTGSAIDWIDTSTIVQTPAILSNGTVPSLNTGITATEVNTLLGTMTGFGVSNLPSGTGTTFTITNGQTLGIVGGTDIQAVVNTTNETITLNYTGSAGSGTLTGITEGPGITVTASATSPTVAVDYIGADSLVMEAADAVPDHDDYIIFGADASGSGDTNKIQFTDVDLSLFNNDSGFAAGTVTSVGSGPGLTGGPFTVSGSIAVDYLGTDSIIKAAPTASGAVAIGDFLLVANSSGNVFETTMSNLPFVTTTGNQSIAGVKSFSGKIGADGGIDGLTNANGGISGSNYNITGVNVLQINDPGEGIEFSGTTTLYLDVIDDSVDNKLRLRNAVQFDLNSTARITNLVNPTGAQDAATKNYVDTEIGNIPSGLAFEGNWNASTDTPTLAGTTQDNGKFWIVSVAGSTNLSGITDWAVGDWAIYVDNGAGTDAWQKVDNSSSLAGAGSAGKVTFWSSTSNVSFNNNFTYDGTYLTAPRMRVGDGTDGYFYSDTAGRTAFASGDFYIQGSVNNYYNYATTQYHGNASGDNHLFRGNPLSGNNWDITAAGAATFAGSVTGGVGTFTGTLTVGTTAGSNINMLRTSANYISATNATGYLVFRTGGFDTALTLNSSQNATFAGDLTVSGGDITLGGTGRIQGVDTVSAGTDAANKTYVDTKLSLTGGTMANTNLVTNMNADLLDGISSGSFLRSDAADIGYERISFHANNSNNWDTIATASQNQGGIEIFNSGSGNDAFMAFHAGNDYAFYFGIDADNNQLSVGGWSMGANKYKVWNESNDGAGSGLDADLLDGQQGSYYATAASLNNYLPLAGGTMTGTISMGTQIFATAGNYGRGVFGLYSPSRYQHVWSMGTAYKLADAGTSTGTGGNLYGLAWSYNPDHGGVGNNAQAKAGLNHQLLLMQNGTTTFAAGTGMWTNGTITANNGQIVLNGTGRIQGIDTVSASTDAANKLYVDNAVGGVPGESYINAATFSTSNGIITGTGVGSAGFTVDIDGRYPIGNVALQPFYLSLQQNPVGTTYGDGVSAVPTYYFGQKAGDNDAMKFYAESAASNDITAVWEINDDIETGLTWLFRNKKTYSPYTATDALKIDGDGDVTVGKDLTVTGGDIILSGTGRIQGVDTVTSSTDAANKAYVDAAVAGVPVGDITGVTAGTNLNGGGTSGTVILNLDAAIELTSVQYGSGVTLSESSDRADLLYINSSTSTWGGLQIGNTSNEFIFSLMGDGNVGGIYDDQNGDWIIQWTENTGIRLYYNAAQKFTTTSTGVTISGALVADGGNSAQWNTAYDNSITGLAVTGTTTKTLTATQQDGGTLTASWTDNNDNTNWYVNAATFNTGNGIITGTGVGSAGFTVDIDGRYLPLAGGVMSGKIGRSSAIVGFLEGSYNNVGANGLNTNPIYTIGSSYNPASTTLSNMYGVGYTSAGASFITLTGASNWGFYVAADGDARVWLDGSNGNISAAGTIYASGGNSSQWNTHTSNTGTVTSVGLSIDTDDAISISSTPITSSGTIALEWQGDSSQVVLGSGELADYYTGDISGVTAGTGLTGGGTSGTVTLNVIGGSGITANANDIAVDSTVLRTSGNQTRTGLLQINGAITFPTSSGGTLARGQTYAIYQESGSWTNPYPDLCIGFHTGISMGANASYNGMRFFNDYTLATQVMSINNASDGLGANNVYINNGLRVNGGIFVLGNTGVGDMYLGNYSTGNYFRFHTNNSQTYFDMNCGQINWRQGASTRYYFYPSTANMTINGTLTQNSDSRVKENVVEIGNCISKVQAMRGVYYNRTDFNTEVTKVGVIAQEVEAVLPELILEAPDTGLKSVAYAELTAVLINAIKEQQEIIENLTTRIEQLEN